MHWQAKRRFIVGQGFDEPATAECGSRFSALMFQPRVVGLTLVAGIAFQSVAVFAALSAALLWSALAPRLNPFEHTYNAILGRRPGAVRLGPAPAPRRFAQGLAGTWSVAIAAALSLGWTAVAITLQATLVAAVGALVFGGFCLGSFIYHRIRGWRSQRAARARRGGGSASPGSTEVSRLPAAR